MSEAYFQQKQPTLIWNPARGVWEKAGMANLLCEHWELFSETWPTAGMTRNGQVFELPMQEHRTTDSEYSSSPILRTPAASEAERGHQPEDKSRARGGQVTLSGQMMTYFRTPNAMDGDKGSYATATERLEAGRQVNLHNEINEIGTDWGKFAPAIKRWEEVLGRPAPAPTKPDGKDGAHRLSSAFTEWMMGLEPGWITDCGLSRNDELKACGNGVVPQQAELALRVLLEGVSIPRGGGQVNLPTPTVSDTFTDNLASTQQKEGSMHSVTLPQAVRMVSGRIEEDRPQ